MCHLLVFRGDRLSRQLLYRLFSQVTEGDHANCLPHAQTDTRRYTTVQTSHAIGLVDVFEGVCDCHLLRPVGIVLLRLHFDSNDLDRLVPSTESTTYGGCEDLLTDAEFDFLIGLAGHAANGIFTVCLLLVAALGTEHFVGTYANLLRPNLDPQFVTCRTATAFTPLLIPAMPSFR